MSSINAITHNTNIEKVSYSLIVLNYNNASETLRYVNAILEYDSIDHIMIVDNKSTDNSFEQLKELKSPKVDVVSSGKNGGYGYGNNFGIRELVEKYHSKYIAISNPDVKFEENTGVECARFLVQNESASYFAVAPVMINITGEKNKYCAWDVPRAVNYLFFSLPVLGKVFKLDYKNVEDTDDSKYLNCDCIAGSFLMVNAELFSNIGMYDEGIFLYCEETSLGIRAKKKGYRSAMLLDQTFIHAHSTTISKEIKGKAKRLNIMWNSRLHVLENEYKWGKVRMVLARIVKCIYLLEVSIFG